MKLSDEVYYIENARIKTAKISDFEEYYKTPRPCGIAPKYYAQYKDYIHPETQETYGAWYTVKWENGSEIKISRWWRKEEAQASAERLNCMCVLYQNHIEIFVTLEEANKALHDMDLT